MVVPGQDVVENGCRAQIVLGLGHAEQFLHGAERLFGREVFLAAVLRFDGRAADFRFDAGADFFCLQPAPFQVQFRPAHL